MKVTVVLRCQPNSAEWPVYLAAPTGIAALDWARSLGYTGSMADLRVERLVTDIVVDLTEEQARHLVTHRYIHDTDGNVKIIVPHRWANRYCEPALLPRPHPTFGWELARPFDAVVDALNAFGQNDGPFS